MQIDLNLIPEFEAISDCVTGVLFVNGGGLGIAELMFFLATYIWEITGGEGGASMTSGLF